MLDAALYVFVAGSSTQLSFELLDFKACTRLGDWKHEARHALQDLGQEIDEVNPLCTKLHGTSIRNVL